MQIKNKKFLTNSIKIIGFFVCFFLIGLFITSGSSISENPVLIIKNKNNSLEPSITIDYTPPYWDPPLSNQISIFGNNFSYQVTARDTESDIDSIWLSGTKTFQINLLEQNNTENWAIAEIGNITSLSVFLVGKLHLLKSPFFKFNIYF
jgi:hypothetical protein